MSKLRVNVSNVAAAFRTAGALMAGNAFVGHFVFGKTISEVISLFAAGVALMLIFSLERR
jgi:hypothetical protein